MKKVFSILLLIAFSKNSDSVCSNNVQVDVERLPTEAKLYALWEYDSLSLKPELAVNQNAEYRFIFALGGGNILLGYLQ